MGRFFHEHLECLDDPTRDIETMQKEKEKEKEKCIERKQNENKN